MKNKLYIFSAIGVIILFAAIALFMLPNFDISEIQINGLDNISEEEARAMLTFKEGDNIFLAGGHKSEENIRANNYVESVKIKKALPSTVVVDITEYKLRAYVPYMGRYLYINDMGKVLDVKDGIKKQLPVVEGLKFNNFTLGEVLKVDNLSNFDTVVELSRLFEKYSLLGEVVRVDVSDVSEIHFYIGKIDVIFGGIDNANRKMLVLIEVMKQLDSQYPGRLNLTGENAAFEYLK